MTNILRVFSFSYFLILSFVFLIPVNSVVSVDNQPSNNTSYLIHIILLFFMYLLFHLSFSNEKKILVFCLSYSLIIEFMQIFTSRGFQLFDILSNLLGVIISFLFCIIFLKIKNSKDNLKNY